MDCPNCATPNADGAKFCMECGTRLDGGCPSCGASNPPTARFCAACGTRLAVANGANQAPGPGTGRESPGGAGPPPHTERRLVSILFADLVGFTSRSDGSDPETVRDFQAGYFELAREVVARYGGTVEKFIGDAVMAVWGTPVAREDDAELAVRTGLDLVDTVRHLGGRTEGPELQLRAAVLTGEAAVTLGAVGQGMVAGDLVNTASRLQSVAPPGTVIVGEATYRAASRAVVFEPAGEQLLRGKAAPVPAWRAVRVVAERGGVGRSEGVEAPFVGRDDELRLLKDFFHATARERRARLISVTGIAGIGKSRLTWEFLKYIDGVLETVYWHEGRSPAFGEGVTFWALGEMVRRRAGLAEADDDPTTRERIAATLSEFVPDEAERRSIEPALLSLLGVGEPATSSREELFAAWRTFFERIADVSPAVLVFEDLQWADPGLLDFIDHLIEWSSNHPLYVITLARPELLDRRPAWGAGQRDFVALALGALPEAAMRELLEGLVPGLPDPTVRAILARADGIPLYAVETVRMLVSEGRLEEADGAYRPVGELAELHVPESLHALIAARLDALDPADRALIQDAAVLGHTFSIAGLGALTGEPPEALQPRLHGLARREILAQNTDPRSPERGQFGFGQGLIREVAYSMLARRERRARHLAAARYFESLGDDEVAGILATHYLDAFHAAPDGPEADAVAVQARIALRAAAERAAGLGSHEQAIGFLRRALDVTTDPAEETALLERIGAIAAMAGRREEAAVALGQARERHDGAGDRPAAARVTALAAENLLNGARVRDAAALLEQAEEEFGDLAPHPAVVHLRAQLARARMFAEDFPATVVWADRALADAEHFDLVPVIADLLVTKGSALTWSGRWREGMGLVEAGSRLAQANGLHGVVLRAAVNLTGSLLEVEPRRAVELTREAVALAVRYGYRTHLLPLLNNAFEASLFTGDWEWIASELERLRPLDLVGFERHALTITLAELTAVRGHPTAELVAEMERSRAGLNDPGTNASTSLALEWIALAEGRFADVEPAAERVFETNALNAPPAAVVAARAAIRRRDVGRSRAWLERLSGLGVRGPALQVDRASVAAGVAALDGDWPDAARRYRDVAGRYREFGLELSRGLTWLEVLTLAPDGDQLIAEVVDEARAIFERSGAGAFLAQLDGLVEARPDLDRRSAPGDRPATDAVAAGPGRATPS